MSVQEKQKKLLDYVQEKISSGEFAAGQQLPPVRELMGQFGLSYSSANRAIDTLCQMGLAKKMAGSGTYVQERRREPCEKARYKLAVFMTGVDRWYHPGIYPTVFLGLQKAAEQSGCSVTVNYLHMDDFSSERMREDSPDADAIILLSEFDMRVADITAPVPVVGVCMYRDRTRNISYVDLDPFAAAQDAVAYFRGQEIKTVEIHASEAPAYRMRATLFASQWRAAGGAVLMHPNHDYHTVESAALAPGNGHLFVTGALYELWARDYRLNNDRDLWQDMAVLSVDGRNRIDPTLCPGPTIAADWQGAGRFALEEAIYRIQNPGVQPKRIYIPGTLEIPAESPEQG